MGKDKKNLVIPNHVHGIIVLNSSNFNDGYNNRCETADYKTKR